MVTVYRFARSFSFQAKGRTGSRFPLRRQEAARKFSLIATFSVGGKWRKPGVNAGRVPVQGRK
jgi:hypothetical protein